MIRSTHVYDLLFHKYICNLSTIYTHRLTYTNSYHIHYACTIHAPIPSYIVYIYVNAYNNNLASSHLFSHMPTYTYYWGRASGSGSDPSGNVHPKLHIPYTKHAVSIGADSKAKYSAS